MLNQNVYTPKNPTEQKLSLALAISKELLDGKGAWRVHGGGFAGVIAALIPQDATQEYVDYIAKFVGAENVYPMQIRAAGAIHLEA